MTESMIQRDIMKYLQLWGFKVFKLSDRFRAGIPDLYAARYGKSYWFEVKAPGGRVSKIQEYELQQLRDAGLVAMVVRSVAEVAAAVGYES